MLAVGMLRTEQLLEMLWEQNEQDSMRRGIEHGPRSLCLHDLGKKLVTLAEIGKAG